MAISPFPITSILLLISLLFLAPPHCAFLSSNSVVSELSALQSQSPTGVIHLTEALLRRIQSLPTPRPFYALIFFDIQQLHYKYELALPAVKFEFSLVSSSFKSNNPSKKSELFFFEVEFKELESSFDLFGVNSIPHIRLLPPTASDFKADSIAMESSDFSKLADSMSEFIEFRTKLSVGKINRPSIVSKRQIMFLVAIILISFPFGLKKLISGNTIFHEKIIWLFCAIFVYFFSVSGVMFKIIRRMPMFMADSEASGKFVYFYPSSGKQLGTEGFLIGFLYTIVGCFLGLVTHVLVRVRNRNSQRLFMIFLLFVSFWAVKKVIFLDNWKTGYSIHGYWPSRWQ